jgi:RNA polymerase sigma-70 factor (ECF subfamily)
MKDVTASSLPRLPVRLVPADSAEPSSEELVRALVAGERWATERAWEDYAPMVFRLLERGLGPGGDAEDVTQDVFLRVYSRVHTLKDPNALRSFVYSVAIRVLKWELRRRRVRRFLTLSPAGELPELPVRGSDQEARDILRRFYAVMERLSSDERALYTLRFLEALTVREIAEAFGISAATVKRRLTRVSRRLSELVAADKGLASYLEQLGATNAEPA